MFMANLYNFITNEQGSIVYAGEDSTNYGIVVGQSPSFERPTRKQQVYSIPGRNGSVVIPQDAWEDVVRSYNVWIAEQMEEDSGGIVTGTLAERIDAFMAVLNSQKGYQRLEDNFEPDIYRLAYYSGGNEFTNNMIQYGESTLKFTCRPERFLKSGETAITVTNGSTLVNPTKFIAKPLIHIEVASQTTITVAIGDNTISASVLDYINIDCETMNAYRLTSENKNGDISGNFPVIPTGSSTVGITGTATLVTVTPRYFTI